LAIPRTATPPATGHKQDLPATFAIPGNHRVPTTAPTRPTLITTMTVAAAGLPTFRNTTHFFGLEFGRVVLPYNLNRAAILSFCPTGADDDF